MGKNLNTVWALAHKTNGKKIYGVTLQELHTCHELLSPAERSHWLVWQHQWDSWHAFETMEFSEREEIAMPEEPPTVNQVLNEEAEDEELVGQVMRDVRDELPPLPDDDGVLKAPKLNLNIKVDDHDDIVANNSANVNFTPRKYKRHFKHFKVEINIDGNVFETETENISVGGLKLKEPLPFWVVGYFTAKFTHPKQEQAVEHTCSVVDNQAPDKRTRLEFAPFKKKETEEQLEDWIMAA